MSKLMGVVLAAALSACLADPDSIFPERIRQTAVNDIIGSYYAFDPFLAASGRQGRSGREYKPNPVRFYDEPEPYHPSPPPRHQAAAKLYKAEPYKPSHHIHSEKPYVPAYEPKAVHEQPPVYHPKSLKPAFVDGKPYKPAYAEVKHHKPSYVEPKPYKPYKPAFDPYHIDFEPYRPNSYADNPDHHYKPGYEASYKPAYVEPEPYKPAYVEPEPYKPAYVEPEPYKPAYVEAEPYKPAYVEAKPYKPVYAEPEPYKPAYVEAEPYKPAYVEPKPYKPAYEHYEVEHRPLKPYPESIYDKLDKFPASLTELRNFPLDSEDYKAPHGYGHLPAYVEEPRHAPPKSAYAVPPKTTYGAPKPTYGAPKPTYGAPKPTYGAPKPTYGAPKPTYGAPKPTPVAPPASSYVDLGTYFDDSYPLYPPFPTGAVMVPPPASMQVSDEPPLTGAGAPDADDDDAPASMVDDAEMADDAEAVTTPAAPLAADAGAEPTPASVPADVDLEVVEDGPLQETPIVEQEPIEEEVVEALAVSTASSRARRGRHQFQTGRSLLPPRRGHVFDVDVGDFAGFEAPRPRTAFH